MMTVAGLAFSGARLTTLTVAGTPVLLAMLNLGVTSSVICFCTRLGCGRVTL